MNEAFHDAICQEVVWKHPEMKAFAVSLVDHAIRLLTEGREKFTTDIVPDCDRGTGTGIAGSVVELLKNAHVIEPVGVNAGGKWYAERERSTREDRKGAWLNVYKLRSRNVAVEFLRRSKAGAQPERREQMEMV